MSLSTEESSTGELTHYGVLGMKWGHRKSATTADIKAARNRISKKQAEYAIQDDKRRSTKRGTAARTRETQKLERMKTSFLKNPDRAVATRMTRGEKAAALILTVPTGGVAGIAAIAGTSAVSRRIEYKQDKGAYDKKK